MNMLFFCYFVKKTIRKVIDWQNNPIFATDLPTLYGEGGNTYR